MKTKFYGKKISGMLVLLPENEFTFEEDMKFNSLSEKQNLKLKNTMGYDRHRFFKEDSYLSQIATYGLNYLFENGLLKRDDISALVVATTTPDFLMPSTSNLIMASANLNSETFCMDTNQQCAGFVNGLFEAFMLLNNDDAKKVVLITGDVLCKNPDRSNTSSYPLAGDAVCITIVENDGDNSPAYFHSVVNTEGYDALIFPSMGYRRVTDEERAKFASSKYGGYDYLDCIHMDGQAVFQYVMQDVPKYINETLEFSKKDKDEMAYYFFHQPNKFMVDKLAQKLGVSSQKVPSNVVTFYGNSNSSTIPVCMAHNAKDELLGEKRLCMLAGFGAGLNYAGIVMELGKFDFCEMVVTKF